MRGGRRLWSSAAPSVSAALPGARALFTRRGPLHGPFRGASAGPFASFDLARHVGDDPTAVDDNRARLAETMGTSVRFVEQVHSAVVEVVESPTAPAEPVVADAMVTSRRDVALGILVADCMPVLLADQDAGVVAAAHVGRVGLLDGVLEATVAAMRGLGADPARTHAVIGPHACGRCYEVPASMRAEAEERLPGIGGTTMQGTASLVLAAGARTVLRGAGLGEDAIEVMPLCTIEDERFYSYRRSSRTGRFAGVVRLAG